MVAQKTRERRKHKRYTVELKVEYSTGDKFSADFAKNISHGGMFIHTTKPLDTGTIVNLRFYIPGQKVPLNLKGEVRWMVRPEEVRHRSQMPGMGIRFLDLTPRKVSRIKNFVKKLEEEREE